MPSTPDPQLDSVDADTVSDRSAGYTGRAAPDRRAPRGGAGLYAPLRAEAGLVRGELLLLLARNEEAEDVFAEASMVALRSGHHGVAVKLLSDLGFVIGTRRMRADEAIWTGRTAIALAKSANEDSLTRRSSSSARSTVKRTPASLRRSR